MKNKRLKLLLFSSSALPRDCRSGGAWHGPPALVPCSFVFRSYHSRMLSLISLVPKLRFITARAVSRGEKKGSRFLWLEYEVIVDA